MPCSVGFGTISSIPTFHFPGLSTLVDKMRPYVSFHAVGQKSYICIVGRRGEPGNKANTPLLQLSYVNTSVRGQCIQL